MKETTMHRHGISRRLVLGTLAALCGMAAIGGASAKDPVKVPAYGSTFKMQCEIMESEYSEDGWGNANCHHEDGGWTQCDEQGKDCWYTPPKQLPPVYPRDPYELPGDEATADPGGPVDPGPARVDDSRAVADDDEDDLKRKKKGKKRRHGAKRGRR